MMVAHEDHQNTFEDLIIGHFDGSLSVNQERKLAKAIVESPESKRLFLSHMRMEGRLHSLGYDGFLHAADAQDVNMAAEPADSTQGLRTKLRQLQSARAKIWAAFSSIAVCVALIAFLSSGPWPSSVKASTVLQRAQQAAADLVDRAYRVTLLNSTRPKDITDQELMLHIRGSRLFVIQPADGSYLMGRDGNDYWLAQQSGPVWVTEDYRALAPEMQRKIPNRKLLGLAASPDEPFMMQMSSLLLLIERSYDIQLLDSSDPGENHVRAVARFRKERRPKTIEFWADTETGVVVRTELKWGNNRLTRFELVDSPAMSDQWYQHSVRSPNREVTRLETAP